MERRTLNVHTDVEAKCEKYETDLKASGNDITLATFEMKTLSAHITKPKIGKCPFSFRRSNKQR